MDVREAILSRRTHKKFTGEPVSREVIKGLLELARWAPNHRHTNPWRFRVMMQDALARFRDFALSNAEAIGGEAKADKIRMKAERDLKTIGAVIIVTNVINSDPAIAREDYAACAAACQNIALGATAQGLGTLWSTGGFFCAAKSCEFFEIGTDEEIVGAMVIGVPSEEAKSAREPLDDKVRWL